MPYLLNAVYFFFLLASSPYLIYKSLTTGKYRRGLWAKLRGRAPNRASERPCAWFHGVSVGEIVLLEQVVKRFQERHPNWECLVSTTTDTGFEEAHKRFPSIRIFYWPLDFTWAVKHALNTARPDLIVLAEGEVWPNFVWAARDRGIPVVVINGRMSPRSLRRYRRIRLLARSWLRSVSLYVVQTEAYAQNLRTLGVPTERLHVLGSIKYDGVTGNRRNPRTQELSRLLNAGSGQLIWIVGSTQAPEEAIALDLYRRLVTRHPSLRLVIVPRQKDRFDEVAKLLRQSGLPFVRRTQLDRPAADSAAVVLFDTIGELGALWGLADLAFVGGSMDGRRGGQNMIEPAAYGAAVLFGPHVWNFRETASKLLDAQAAIQVADSLDLEKAIARLILNPAERQRLGRAAQEFVRSQQGATDRTLDCLDALLQSGLVSGGKNHGADAASLAKAG